MTGVKGAGVRAIPWDRPGFHNSCMILILPNPDGKGDAELLAAWQAGKLEEVELPQSVAELTTEIIAEAYDGELDLS